MEIELALLVYTDIEFQRCTPFGGLDESVQTETVIIKEVHSGAGWCCHGHHTQSGSHRYIELGDYR